MPRRRDDADCFQLRLRPDAPHPPRGAHRWPGHRQEGEYLESQGYEPAGCHHHEIYLNDPHRARPENIRTVLRMPAREQSASAGGVASSRSPS
ncbi:hypothetical protein E7Z54_06145 [Nocardioides sp.]|nr:hypothetical protein E7Z54_06145 [Nocardioides sp.]